MRRLTLPLTTFVLVTTVAATQAQPNLLPNGSFDADIEHWTGPVDPAVSVAWDPIGNPDGSLRVEIAEPNITRGVHSACISGPSGLYTVRGQSLRPAGEPALMICRASIRGWSQANCEGSMLTLGAPPPPPAGEWIDWEYSQVLGEGSSSGVESIVVDLSAERLGGTGTTTCYFDNIHLTGPIPSPLEVPTLGGIGIAALSALLLLAALVALRR